MLARPLTIVLSNDAKDIAGGENYVLYLAAGLRERGHTVIIAPLTGSMLAAASRERGFETLAIPYASRGRGFLAARMLARRLRGRGVDVIHTNSNRDRTAGAIAAAMLRCACVASVHSCLSIQRNLTHWMRNRYLIHHFTPVGHSTRRIMMETDRIPAEAISVVHIGIPEHEIGFSAQGRAHVRHELGLRDDQPLLGNLARLVAFKGHAHLLSAMPSVLGRFPDARCAVAGDGELRLRLERQADDLGIAHAVRFLGHRTDVGDFLSACDLYVQPSIDLGGETFPVSILNAMAVGLATVASDVGDIRHMVADRETGLLVTETNAAELADAMIDLLADPTRCGDMGRRARERFLERFTLPAMTRSMEEVYAKVVRVA